MLGDNLPPEPLQECVWGAWVHQCVGDSCPYYLLWVLRDGPPSPSRTVGLCPGPPHNVRGP